MTGVDPRVADVRFDAGAETGALAAWQSLDRRYPGGYDRGFSAPTVIDGALAGDRWCLYRAEERSGPVTAEVVYPAPDRVRQNQIGPVAFVTPEGTGPEQDRLGLTFYYNPLFGRYYLVAFRPAYRDRIVLASDGSAANPGRRDRIVASLRFDGDDLIECYVNDQRVIHPYRLSAIPGDWTSGRYGFANHQSTQPDVGVVPRATIRSGAVLDGTVPARPTIVDATTYTATHARSLDLTIPSVRTVALGDVIYVVGAAGGGGTLSTLPFFTDTMTHAALPGTTVDALRLCVQRLVVNEAIVDALASDQPLTLSKERGVDGPIAAHVLVARHVNRFAPDAIHGRSNRQPSAAAMLPATAPWGETRLALVAVAAPAGTTTRHASPAGPRTTVSATHEGLLLEVLVEPTGAFPVGSPTEGHAVALSAPTRSVTCAGDLGPIP